MKHDGNPLHKLDYLDEELIEEAATATAESTASRHSSVWIGLAVAACLCLLSVGLYPLLRTPPTADTDPGTATTTSAALPSATVAGSTTDAATTTTTAPETTASAATTTVTTTATTATTTTATTSTTTTATTAATAAPTVPLPPMPYTPGKAIVAYGPYTLSGEQLRGITWESGITMEEAARKYAIICSLYEKLLDLSYIEIQGEKLIKITQEGNNVVDLAFMWNYEKAVIQNILADENNKTKQYLDKHMVNAEIYVWGRYFYDLESDLKFCYARYLMQEEGWTTQQVYTALWETPTYSNPIFNTLLEGMSFRYIDKAAAEQTWQEDVTGREQAAQWEAEQAEQAS